MPLTTGDSARYLNDRTTDEETQTIDRVSGDWKHHKEFAGLGPLWFWSKTTHERVYLYSTAAGTYQMFCDFDARVGTTFTIDVNQCNMRSEVRIAAKGTTITTNAGTFPDCVELDVTTSCRGGGLMKMVFAKNVGLIKYDHRRNTGTMHWELEAASVGGQTFPQATGLMVAASMPRPTAVINMRPGAPNAPTTIRANMAVTNATGTDHVFKYDGGQEWEISVINASGATVATWSNGRPFHKAIMIKTLSDGDTWSFAGSVTLADTGGVALPAGNYTVRFEMWTEPDAATSHKPGSAPVSVETPLTIMHAL
jgi:hypothetical protein